MVLPAGYLAILPGQSEWLVLLVIGLLLFGRRLPEVGRALGKTVADLRRGMSEFKNQINSDESLREARDSVNEIRRAVDVPRIATDPKRLIRKLAEEPLATPTPQAQPDDIAATHLDPPPRTPDGDGDEIAR